MKTAHISFPSFMSNFFFDVLVITAVILIPQSNTTFTFDDKFSMISIILPLKQFLALVKSIFLGESIISSGRIVIVIFLLCLSLRSSDKNILISLLVFSGIKKVWLSS